MDHVSAQFLSVARGDEPADVVLARGRIINVFSGEIEEGADIAIFKDRIAGVGRGYRGRERVELNGSYVAPGLIDAHVHIESSLCVPAEFARAILPRGVTAVVTDPHEIANVAGTDGVRFIYDATRDLALDVTVMAPSCVPATNMATSGGELNAHHVQELRDSGVAHGLAEVMNFPGVIGGDAAVLAKLRAMSGRPIDGHCPSVRGMHLNAYAAAGIESDHECVTVEEAREKLARGLYLLIREATNARNLDALLPLVTPANSRRICFCTDDRTPVDLLNVGSIDYMLRRAIEFGVDPIDAIRMTTLNTSEFYGLRHLGAIAPGRTASVMVFDNLKKPEARMVFTRGVLTARDGTFVGATPASPSSTSQASRATQASPLQGPAPGIAGRCEVRWDRVGLDVRARSNRVRVIGSLPDQLVTEHRVLDVHRSDGLAVSDVSRDVLKMAVIERHKGTGNCGVGFIQGFGLTTGAIAGTVAHDHHNLVCIGADDRSMLSAAHAVCDMGGGLAVAVGENIVAKLPLPVGGLMSDRPIGEVAGAYEHLVSAARELGSPLKDPFMAMSFMALEVIPALKLTDQGLVDVEQFKIVDLFT